MDVLDVEVQLPSNARDWNGCWFDACASTLLSNTATLLQREVDIKLIIKLIGNLSRNWNSTPCGAWSLELGEHVLRTLNQ